MLIVCCVIGWLAIGLLAFFDYMRRSSSQITLGDVLVAPFFGLAMPMAVLVWAAYCGDKIVIWRRKC